ncbi:MAG: hypothetical protein KGZ61_06490 [Sandarakinorhabdus sp.]|nr:hypothetical protein [Sandarakinorhabdus sp.]
MRKEPSCAELRAHGNDRVLAAANVVETLAEELGDRQAYSKIADALHWREWGKQSGVPEYRAFVRKRAALALRQAARLLSEAERQG